MTRSYECLTLAQLRERFNYLADRSLSATLTAGNDPAKLAEALSLRQRARGLMILLQAANNAAERTDDA